MIEKEKKKRVRRYYSIEKTLILKAKEAAIAAVQIFNSPAVTFKSEIFIVLTQIAWTYLLHAYYKSKNIEYRYFEMAGPSKRRKFVRVNGDYKFWELSKCLKSNDCPLSEPVKQNLWFLIELRNRIEHRMCSDVDTLATGRLQACCNNFNDALRTLFNEEQGLESLLSFSLQFATLAPEQIEDMKAVGKREVNIAKFVTNFDQSLTDEIYDDPRFSYRAILVRRIANRKGHADHVIEVITPNSELEDEVNKVFLKETEKEKFLPKVIVDLMKSEGFPEFKQHNHTILWKSKQAKDPKKAYGGLVAGKHWYWYKSWVEEVRKHCQENKEKYS